MYFCLILKYKKENNWRVLKKNICVTDKTIHSAIKHCEPKFWKISKSNFGVVFRKFSLWQTINSHENVV